MTNRYTHHDAPYAFGDLQGCHAPFRQLLAQLPREAHEPLWFVGDLVNRGPASLATLRDLISLGDVATSVLGNHDFHLLAVAAGIRRERPGDTLADILAAPDSPDLIDWLRHRPIAHFSDGFLMAHAGVLPQWDLTLALELADELGRALRAPNWADTLASLYEKGPNQWSPDLKKADRLRVAFNAFTRLRFCSPDGTMEFSANGGPASAPTGYLPWFDAPERRTSELTVVVGHWAALGLMLREDVIALDSGCVWGNKLSAVRLSHDAASRTLFQVACEGCRKPAS